MNPEKSNSQWHIVGARNVLNGAVHYLDAYILGRAKLIEFYTAAGHK